MRRFYASIDNFHNEGITLGYEETKHLRNVLRLSFGDQIQVFDGLGNEFLCEITGIVKKQTSLKIIENIYPRMPESTLDLTLAVALLKGDKFDLVIQKAVELGIQKFVPLISQRCDVKFRNGERKIERWTKIIIGATKQCGRAKLMEIIEPVNFKEFVKTIETPAILFSERNGESFSAIKQTSSLTSIVGSEGGWEDTEIDFARQNSVQIITLGGRIMRAETAAISIPTILQHRFGDLN
jgi:16S rRNA (uracil1498-N3)-methyltransferase